MNHLRDANQGLTKVHEVFVTEVVKELLEHGCVVQVGRQHHKYVVLCW